MKVINAMISDGATSARTCDAIRGESPVSIRQPPMVERRNNAMILNHLWGLYAYPHTEW